MSSLRKGAQVALRLITAASTPAPAIAAPLPIRDGEPTAEACASVGYSLRTHREDDRYAHRRMGGRMFPAPPPPPPSPMVMASPSVALHEMAIAPAKSMPHPGYSQMAGDVETERYPHATANPVKRTADEPVSTLSADVDTAAYANVRRMLQNGQTPPSDSVRVEELLNYFDYGYARPESPGRPSSPMWR